MDQRLPKVSIGMPVYNGERYIREAIDSILAQTFTDFELVISDNGSSDATEQLCRQYANADKRIRYIRHNANHGPSWNFRYVFEQSVGDYFKWMAHDDRCDPRLIAQCVNALDANHEAVLCFSKMTMIDERQSTQWPVIADRRLDHTRADQRFRNLLQSSCFVLEVHGLMRSKVLRTTPLIENYATADRILVARMALMGPFIELSDYLFYYRLHSGQSSSTDRYAIMNWFNPQGDGHVALPQWRLYREYFRAVHTTPLPTDQRIWCYIHLLRFPMWERNWRRLGKDVLVAARALGATLGRRLTSKGAQLP